LALLPGTANRTAEAARPENPIVRLWRVPSKEGRADEPTRTTRLRAC
jgi:hypothetical protein